MRDVLSGRAPKDSAVTLRGWVRTRRDSKAGISFIHLSDGSSFHPVQVVAPNTLPNYADEVQRLTAGCAVEATGNIVPSPAKLVAHLHALGLNPGDVEGRVDELLGWASVLKRTAGKSDRFFL